MKLFVVLGLEVVRIGVAAINAVDARCAHERVGAQYAVDRMALKDWFLALLQNSRAARQRQREFDMSSSWKGLLHKQVSW